MALDTSFIPTIISGVLITLTAAALLGIWSLIRKGVKDRMAVKTQLNEILEKVDSTNKEQIAQRQDLKLIVKVLSAVLVGSQLTAKSLRREQFNGDLEEGSRVIDEAVKLLDNYVNDKAFPDCEEV